MVAIIFGKIALFSKTGHVDDDDDDEWHWTSPAVWLWDLWDKFLKHEGLAETRAKACDETAPVPPM